VSIETVNSKFKLSGAEIVSLSAAVMLFLPHFVEQNFKNLLVTLADISVITNGQFLLSHPERNRRLQLTAIKLLALKNVTENLTFAKHDKPFIS